MNKHLQLIFGLFLILAVAGLYLLYFTRESEKIAYVDSGKLLSEYNGAAEAQKAYQSKTAVWQANIDTLTLGVQEAIKEHEKDLASMSAREQATSKELIEAKQRQLADYHQAIQENARQEDARLAGSVVSDINGFLLQYGKDHGYSMIFIAGPSGTIAYAREGLDITKDVLEALNRQHHQGQE